MYKKTLRLACVPMKRIHTMMLLVGMLAMAAFSGVSCPETAGGQLCDPGDLRCQGNTIETCRSDGQQWEEVRVCGENESCVAGECIPEIPDSCGNGICEPDLGEDEDTCAVDCPVRCGDGHRSGDEQCDSSDLGGVSCADLGFDEGELGCNDDCTMDTSSCRFISYKVSAGLEHSCAIDLKGSLLCWGRNFSGQLGDGTTERHVTPIQVEPGTTWRQVSAGTVYSCGIKTDGTLWCWGFIHGQHGTPPTQVGGTNDWSAISEAHADVFGIKSNRQLWWVDPRQITFINMLFVPEIPWQKVSNGGGSACGILQKGNLLCWGWHIAGEYGPDAPLFSNEPLQITEYTDWIDVSKGVHICGLRMGGSLYCWGFNRYGEVGDGTFGDENHRTAPIRVGGSAEWSQVSISMWYHTCALRVDGSLYCWGYNRYGQLGDGTIQDRHTPTQVGTDVGWSSVSGGGFHTCAADGSGVLCWGLNNNGQLGNNEVGDSWEPVPPTTGGRYKSLALGETHTCGIDMTGALFCWGSNTLAQLGVGSEGEPPATTAPIQLGSANTWQAVTITGDSATCAVDTAHRLWCWGYKPAGFNYATVEQPTQLGTAMDWLQVDGGGYHSCGVKMDGSLWCWGSNSAGQLGDGTTTHRQQVGQVGDELDWISVRCGYSFSCGVKNTGELLCWGGNFAGQLGVGDTDNRTQPVEVLPQETWLAVASGYAHACGIKDDGSLLCWGLNNLGQLGVGDTVDRATPASVFPGSRWTTISLGTSHSCGIQDDGSLWCWGANDVGELGTGNDVGSLVPVQVGTWNAWRSVEVGVRHSCALDLDDVLYCWGSNFDGQSGREEAWQTRPVRVQLP